MALPTEQAARPQSDQPQDRDGSREEFIRAFADVVAHDFNNILLIVLGYTEQLLPRLESDTVAQYQLQAIQAAGLRGKEIVQRLLTYSRKQLPNLRPFNPAKTLKSIEGAVHKMLRDDIHLTMNVAPVCGWIRGDAGLLEVALLSLLSNAQEALPNGGSIEIDLRDELLEAERALRTGAPCAGQYVVLSVRDTGVGMSPEVLARAFDPFFTTKPKRKRLGLGLPTALRVVQEQGGTAWLESTPGQGTTARLCLPRVDPIVDYPIETQQVVDTQEPAIAVLERDELVQGLLVNVLRAAGYQVVASAQPIDLVAKTRVLTTTRRLLLLGPSPLEPASKEEIQKVAPQLAVGAVLLLSDDPDQVAPIGIAAEARVIPAPFSPQSVLAAVGDLLPRR